MKKQYGLYKHSRFRADDIWELHRKYETIEQAMQALIDASRTPKRERPWRYTVLPVLDQEKKFIRIKAEYSKELLEKAR